MAESLEVFRARIAASDDSTSVIKAIQEHAKTLGLQFDKAGKSLEHLHRPAIWEEMREHVHKSGESFDELREHVGGVGEKLTELVPALGALTAAGSLGAAVEITDKVSESYAVLAHTAETLGMSAQQLHEWNDVAKLSDTSAETLSNSMNKLNISLSRASRGQSKELAAAFKALHIDPRKYKDAADALPAIMDGFSKIKTPKALSDIAKDIFGKGGDEMIPFLKMGSARFREMQEEVRKLQFNFTGAAKGLDEHNESMKRLSIASEGLQDAIGSGLAPVITPIANEMAEWVGANKEWLAADLTGDVRELSMWIKQVPWHQIGEDLRWAAQTAGEFTEKLGGARTVIDVLAVGLAFKGVAFFGSGIAKTIEFGKEIGSLIGKVGELGKALSIVEGAEGMAAKAGAGTVTRLAAAGEAATGGGAAVAGGASLAGAAGALGAGALAGAGAAVVAVPLAYGLKHGDEWLTSQIPGQTEYEAAHAGANLRGGRTGRDPRDNGPRHVYGSTSPAARVDGHVQVTVSLVGAPPGTTVSANSSGQVAAPKVNVGQAFPEWGH